MKTYHKLLPLLALAGVCTLGTACDDDDVDPREDANNRLQGDWEVTSYTEDGEEQLDFTIAAFDMEFEKEDPFEGEFDWDVVYTNGAQDPIRGEYEIEDNGTVIEINGIEYDLELDGDDLEMAGRVNAVRIIIQAERD